MNPDVRRQAALPPPQVQGGAGTSMPGFMTGRVTYVDEDKRTVDVYLENGVPLADVEVMTFQSGPDRDSSDLPKKRSQVAVMFAWGDKAKPYVLGVLPRGGRTVAKPAADGAYRRVFPNGMHFMVADNGDVELVTADGTYLVIGSASEPAETHTGQQRESNNGDPLKHYPDKDSPKPGAFKVSLVLADGSHMKFDGGSWDVQLAANAAIKASGSCTIDAADVTVTASGSCKVEAPSVEVHGTATCHVHAPLLRLNGGTLPIARITDVAIPAGIGNLTVLA